VDLSSGRGPEGPRRGFDRFSVVSRWRRDNPPGSDDPFDENALAAFATTTMALPYGAMRGTIARLVIGMPDWPHLYVTLGEGRRMSVAGDLTHAERVRLADSMAPLAPWSRRAGLDPRRRRG